MRSRSLIPGVLLIFGSCPAVPGEVLDRVAVAAGGQVVTLSAIHRHLRMAELQQGAPAASLPAAAALHQAADRLVDQYLLRREIALSRYVPPSMSEVEPLVEAFLRETAQTPAEFAERLARFGFTEDDFHEELQWRLTLARFIDFRFAPGVQVSEDEIEAAFRNELLPELRRRAPEASVPTLDQHRASLTRLLLQRKTDAAMENWLVQARASIKIRYFDEALRVEPRPPETRP